MIASGLELMPKFVQLCAAYVPSKKDTEILALDEVGHVWLYTGEERGWVRLTDRREPPEPSAP
jgi:hypothetical protein